MDFIVGLGFFASWVLGSSHLARIVIGHQMENWSIAGEMRMDLQNWTKLLAI
jgi:hypothetical protein